MLRALFLALALLAAQQSALAHAFWHADAAQSQGDDEKSLCQLHGAMGAVLGILDAAPAQAPLAEGDETVFHWAADRVSLLAALLPPCRGPPRS